MRGKLLLVILSFSLLFSSQILTAHNEEKWQAIYLTPGGGNQMDGIEAFFKTATCNGETVVYVKFINHNDYSVQLEWFDAVFTQELKWINKDEEVNKKTLKIAPKSQAEGNCMAGGKPELIIYLKSFVAGQNDFKRYSAFQLNVLAIE